MIDSPYATTTDPRHDVAAQPPTDQPQIEERPIEDPAELIRFGTMLTHLANELDKVDLDEASIARLQQLHDDAVTTLTDNLNGDLMTEFQRLVPKLGTDDPSASEVRLAHMTLTGWLDGLVQGAQMTAASQQVQQQVRAAQLAQGRIATPPSPTPVPADGHPGTYL